VTVTVCKPGEAPHYDTTEYSTAMGILERQRVIAPNLDVDEAQLPDYVVALRDPLDHPRYRLVRKFEEGALYARTR